MKFIHCADLHLGKYQNIVNERYFDFFDAFGQIIDIAIEKQVDFVLCCGDMFDSKSPSPQTFQITARKLQKLKNANIPFIAIEGNHDRIVFGSKNSWLKNLSFLGLITLLTHEYDEEGYAVVSKYNNGEGCILETEDYTILGLSYMGAATSVQLKKLQVQKNDKPSILALHAGIEEFLPQDLARISIGDLEHLTDKFNYIALGHIHKTYNEKNIFNPGSSEVTSISEARRGDIKGVYIAEINGSELLTEFIPLNTRKHCFANITVPKGEDALSYILGEMKDKYADSVLELTLSIPDPYIDISELKQKIIKKCNCCIVEIINILPESEKLPEITTYEELENTVILNLFEELGYSDEDKYDLAHFAVQFVDNPDSQLAQSFAKARSNAKC